MELMQANRQWSSRPADERFTSIPELCAFLNFERQCSARRVLPNRKLTVVPSATDDHDIALTGPNGHPAQFTHWSFNQLCSLAGVPASYIRDSRMPGPLAADNINWGLHHVRDVEDCSVLLRRYPDGVDHRQPGVFLGAVNGPEYGVVWNADVADTIFRRFGNGRDGQFRVPGEFGRQVEITQENTTLYASDRDMWCFLADEERRIEVPNRRNGQSGSLARGFYISNSEVGASRLVFGMFLFDYVCCNRRAALGSRRLTSLEFCARGAAAAPLRLLDAALPLPALHAPL